MKAEDVDAALVERVFAVSPAFRALPEKLIRHALAAVLPEIQAQALRDAAGDVSAAPHWPDTDRYTMGWEDAIAAVRTHAAHLTAETEEPK